MQKTTRKTAVIVTVLLARVILTSVALHTRITKTGAYARAMAHATRRHVTHAPVVSHEVLNWRGQVGNICVPLWPNGQSIGLLCRETEVR